MASSNAYELAKQLEQRHAPYEDDAANMLRQQADRIAKLEKKLQESATQYAGNGTAGIQNETKPTGFFFQIRPQIKPLSDEEIQALWTVKHPNVMSLNPDLLEFARAIEERHGIK